MSGVLEAPPAFRRARPGDVTAAAALMRAAYAVWEPLGFPAGIFTEEYVASFFVADGRVAEGEGGRPAAVFCLRAGVPRLEGSGVYVARAHREDFSRLLAPASSAALRGRRFAYAYSLAVDPGLQRRGVGRACLRHVESEASRLGLAGVLLETGERTTFLLEWYKKDGFRVIGTSARDGNPLVLLLKPAACGG